MDIIVNEEYENNSCTYKNPALENYECDGQISLFDLFFQKVEHSKLKKDSSMKSEDITQ